MKRFSVLYGFDESDIERVRRLVEGAIGIELSAHESIYRGGDYYLLEDSRVEFFLQSNYDCLDDELAELDFPEVGVLLYLEGQERAEELGSRIDSIESAKRLRHESS